MDSPTLSEPLRRCSEDIFARERINVGAHGAVLGQCGWDGLVWASVYNKELQQRGIPVIGLGVYLAAVDGEPVVLGFGQPLTTADASPFGAQSCISCRSGPTRQERKRRE